MRPQDALMPTVAAVLTTDRARGLDPSRLTLEKLAARRSKIVRVGLTVILPIQIVLLLIGAGIAANAVEALQQHLRTVSLLIAATITAVALIQINPLSSFTRGTARSMRNLAILKSGSLLFETVLFAVMPDWSKLFWIGVVVVVLSLLCFVLAAIAAFRVQHYDLEDTEIFYTQHCGNARTAQRQAEQTLGTVADRTPEGACNDDVTTITQVVLEERCKHLLVDQHGDEKSPEELVHLSDTLEVGDADLSETIQNWYAVNRMRKALYERDQTGQIVMIALLLFVTALAIGNVTYEFIKIFVHQDPLFSAALSEKYNAKSQFSSYFPSRSHQPGFKVHLVVVDGLRYDMTEPGASDIGDYMATLAATGGAVRLKMEAQLPSFSVPNWITLLTGAPPELTGVTGNLLSSETNFDHIYRQALNYGVHTGMTGTPWWANLVFSYIPTLDGDGTVDAAYVNATTPAYAQSTSDPADWKRLDVALQAIRRARLTAPFGSNGPQQLYEFFLTHFSDVDKQGHEYGVDKKWNTYNSYFTSITNKTQCIKQIVSTMDNATVLVVVSDHGHVYRGGHGGQSQELLHVPAFFYTKAGPITLGPSPEFAAVRNDDFQSIDFAATMCALLGIPTPRQNVGIFMEPIITSNLVPAAVRQFRYYDLFMAKYSLVQQMYEFAASGIFSLTFTGNYGYDAAAFAAIAASKGALTTHQYGLATLALLSEYQVARDTLYNYKYYRNLVFSFVLVGPMLFTLYVVIEHFSIASVRGLLRGTPCSALNLKACVLGFVSVFLYVALSLAAFLIGYFEVTGYSVWDSTLTHTPSVAYTFLSRTVAVPIVVFVLITRVVQFTSIRWHTRDTIRDLRLHRECSHTNALRWIGNFFMDIVVFCLGTSRYEEDKFAEAYLYLYYLAIWACFAAFVLLFLCFPFSFIVPVVFATNFVDADSATMRFRICTMLIIITPLLVGSALLLFLKPTLDQSTLAAWDAAMDKLQIAGDHDELLEAQATIEGDASSSPAEITEVRQRVELIARARDLIALPSMRFLPEALLLTKMAKVPLPPPLPVLAPGHSQLPTPIAAISPQSSTTVPAMMVSPMAAVAAPIQRAAEVITDVGQGAAAIVGNVAGGLTSVFRRSGSSHVTPS